METMPEPRLDNRLRHRRKARGLSQRELAELAGVSRQTIAAIEAGRSVPSTSLALQFAHVLDAAWTTSSSWRLRRDLGFGWSPSRGSTRTRGSPWDGSRDAGSPTRFLPPLLPPPTASCFQEQPCSRRIRAGQGQFHATVRPLARLREVNATCWLPAAPPCWALSFTGPGGALQTPACGGCGREIGGRWSCWRKGWCTSRGSTCPASAGRRRTYGGVRRALPGRRFLVVNLTRWRQGSWSRPAIRWP